MNLVLLGTLGLDVLLRALDGRHVVEDEIDFPLEEVRVSAIFDFEDGIPRKRIRKNSLGLGNDAT